MIWCACEDGRGRSCSGAEIGDVVVVEGKDEMEDGCTEQWAL